MGFPRIISKNNKIYTKLGEFCLSGDGNSFWILCHTCQEELQTQDQFWKHIQDEHNFMHGLNKHEADPNASMLPLPLYRKLNEDEQRADTEDDSHDPQERKNYADMRTIEMDIKTEPQVTAQQAVAAAVAAGHAASHVELGGGGGGGGGTTVYAQLPQVPPGSAYAALVQQHTGVTAMPTTLGHMSAAAAVAAAAAGAGGGGGGGGGGNILPPQLMPQELPKDSNSTTASAGSAAVSSDDGERWYICDYESCGLKFKYQSRLELHRSVHSKERRFACEVCGASFKQSCNLSTHRKKKHSLKGAKSNNNSGVGIGGGASALLQQRF